MFHIFIATLSENRKIKWEDFRLLKTLAITVSIRLEYVNRSAQQPAQFYLRNFEINNANDIRKAVLLASGFHFIDFRCTTLKQASLPDIFPVPHVFPPPFEARR